MNKIASIIIFLSFLSIDSYSQTCLPEGITFTTQSQVDSFQIANPGCSVIEGSLIIGPENSWDEINISNLDSLIVITSILGDLKVWNNDLLPNLSGLDSLINIEGDLKIETNSSVEDLLGLEALTTIGGNLRIYGGNYITSLNGVDNLSSVGGDLTISYSNALADISSLSNLTIIGGALTVQNNATLDNLVGLDNIEYSLITSLTISNNLNLSNCAVLSVCDYITSENAIVQISNNVSACNNEGQVSAACISLSVDEMELTSDFLLYPNPSGAFITISGSSNIENLSIFNQIGQKVYSEKQVQNPINVSNLESGIYILEFQVDKKKVREKLVIE